MTMPKENSITGFLRRWDGALTRELVQQPGRFGLGQVPSRLAPDSVTTLVCGYCSTGCGLDVHIKNGQAVNLTPAADYPVNRGMACPKGWEALAPLHAGDRGTMPLLRGSDGIAKEIGWDSALDIFVDRIRGVQEKYGPDSVAFLSTGQIPTEEMFLLGSVARFGMGIRHGDANTRQCMATANVAYKQSFGFDAPPFTYRDFEESDVMVFVGANPCIAHPILWERVCRNRRSPRILVVDPRRTETAVAAGRHYALRPKSDLILFYGLARILLDKGWVDREFVDAHTDGYEEFVRHAESFTPRDVAEATGLSIADLEEFAESVRPGRRVSWWWTMGVNQGHEAVRTAQAIINLALLTGQIGKPGTGANSITGQVNAMGSRLFSNTSSLAGGRDFANAEHRQLVARRLGIDASQIPESAGLAYDEIIDGVAEGRIKALWVIATNPAHSWINQAHLEKALKNLDFLVVQDMYPTTDTAKLAHLYLPSAGWGEKEGTVINSERRIGLFKQVSRAPGQALADFHIFRLLADRWGCGAMVADWETPERVFAVMRDLSRNTPCDFTGISDYGFIEARGGVQWPFPEAMSSLPEENIRERRLFEDGRFFRANGKALFKFSDPVPAPESPDAEYPFWLLTGRGSSAQWHTNTRTSKSAVLRKSYPADAYVEIHPMDAEAFGLATGHRLRVVTRRGEMEVRVFIASTVEPGQIFIPMHYDGINRLTCPIFDPHSRQPSYKACAARLEKN